MKYRSLCSVGFQFFPYRDCFFTGAVIIETKVFLLLFKLLSIGSPNACASGSGFCSRAASKRVWIVESRSTAESEVIAESTNAAARRRTARLWRLGAVFLTSP